MTTRLGVGGVTETPKQTVSDKGFPAARNSGTRVNSATGTAIVRRGFHRRPWDCPSRFPSRFLMDPLMVRFPSALWGQREP